MQYRTLLLFIVPLLTGCHSKPPGPDFNEFVKRILAKDKQFFLDYKKQREKCWDDKWALESADTCQVTGSDDGKPVLYTECILRWSLREGDRRWMRIENYSNNNFPELRQAQLRFYYRDTLAGEGIQEFIDDGRIPLLRIMDYTPVPSGETLYAFEISDTNCASACSYYAKANFGWKMELKSNLSGLHLELSNDSAIYKNGEAFSWVEVKDSIIEDDPLLKRYNDSVPVILDRLQKEGAIHK